VNQSVVMNTNLGHNIFGVPEGCDSKQVVNETWDVNMALSWMQTCLQDHISTCTERLAEVVDMALIDCDSMSIVQADASSRWVALSYVWGAGYQSITVPRLRSGSRLPDCLPRTIDDAITVTKQLGYRFLWVDEYCIDQHSEQQRNLQIGHMDEIYRHADVTIVAAAGDNKAYGLPGVNKTKRRRIKAVSLPGITLFANVDGPGFTLEKTKWFTRAWFVLIPTSSDGIAGSLQDIS
jgi:hypothetical protein